MKGTRGRSLGQEDPLEKEMAPTPVLLPGKSHGRRSVVGYSPWGRKESDTTERLHFHFIHFVWITTKGKVKLKVKSLSRVRLFTTPWTVAYQAPPSMRFSRQE